MPAWTNWVGNQMCAPAALATPASEDEVAELVAARSGACVSPARGTRSRRSSSPTACCSTCADFGGIRSIDAERRRVVVGPATTIGEFGEPLWAAGLALANQGDIVAQQIAGAVVHGHAWFGAAARLLLVVGPPGAPRDRAGRRRRRRGGRSRPLARCPGLGRHARRHDRARARGGPGLPSARARSSTGAGTRPGRASRRSRGSIATTRSSGCRPRTPPRCTGWRRPESGSQTAAT